MKKTFLIAIFLSFFCIVNIAWGEMDVQKITKLAKSGDAEAQNNLGFRLYKGQGVPKNYAEAMKWFRRAADEGFAEAQFNLGTMYYNGEGVLQNYTEAMKWYNKAADQRLPIAQYILDAERRYCCLFR